MIWILIYVESGHTYIINFNNPSILDITSATYTFKVRGDEKVDYFSEDFSNGLRDWEIVNNDDILGEVIIEDNILKIFRADAHGNGGSVGISQDVNIEVNGNTTISFDANAIYRDVRSGSGDKGQENPIGITLILENDIQEVYMLRYAVNYGDVVEDIETLNKTSSIYGTYDFKQIAINANQNEMDSFSFSIQDAFSDATSIKEIYIYGSGWDYEGYIDNISISNSGNSLLNEETTNNNNYIETDVFDTSGVYAGRYSGTDYGVWGLSLDPYNNIEWVALSEKKYGYYGQGYGDYNPTTNTLMFDDGEDFAEATLIGTDYNNLDNYINDYLNGTLII